MKRVLTVIMAGGQGERLSLLSERRAKPAVPFGGKYRVIDFSLSNCVNSGIFNVAVLTQYRPRSLNDHIGSGKPWDLDRMSGGIHLLQPYLGRGTSEWYHGTADAVRQNLDYIMDRNPEQVLVLSGDHIYKMDYLKMLNFHYQRDADLTIAVTEVPSGEISRFGILTADQDNRVLSFAEKPKVSKSNLASMGIYIFNLEVLQRRLNADQTANDFGHDIVPAMLQEDKVFAYLFKGYWRDVGTIQSYWEANMDLIAKPPAFNLFDDKWRIHTKSEERPSALVTDTSKVSQSLISHGCIIEGQVEHSVLSPGVRVCRGAVIKDSIVMFDTVIGKNTVVDHCILDKEVAVAENCYLGFGGDDRPNEEEPARLNTGITLIGKRARIPHKTKIGRNCKVYPEVREDDFASALIASGQSVHVRAP